ncbi:MAG: DUF1800 domain-containing protein [Gaiellaceae bacterium]
MIPDRTSVPRSTVEPSSGRSIQARVPVYKGRFGRKEAERLLWRAGFGPKGDEAAKLAKLGLTRAVDSLVYPRKEKLTGPKPRDEDGGRLAPRDAWGHDGLWWLDRMIRTRRPLMERMTLVWHDWFATSNGEVDSPVFMLRQNGLFRKHALGSFRKLLLDVTHDPAMLTFLSGIYSTRESPNENYARELMELFTLGAGNGYTEDDVREQARALTGWTADWKEGKGLVNFRFAKRLHDRGTKQVFGRSGRYDWADACNLCVRHAEHPSFFVDKLWSYFVPTPPDPATKRALVRMYRKSGYKIRPIVRAVLRHPDFHEGPRMVKPPAVYIAGLLRATGQGIRTESWTWISGLAGQQLFYPPNVAGWDETRWLDTSTYRGRWVIANEVIGEKARDPGSAGRDWRKLSAEQLVNRALRFWGSPSISPSTRAELLAFARRSLADAVEEWQKDSYALMTENALRQLVAVSPDLQTA